MKTIFRIPIIVTAMISSIVTPVSTSETNEFVYDLPEITEADISLQIELYLKNKYSIDELEIISVTLGNAPSINHSGIRRSQSQSYIGEVTEIRNVGYAANQYSQGVVFSEGGEIYYSDSTGADVSMSFSIGGNIADVGVGLGRKANGVTGYAVECAPGKACKIYVKKKIRVVLYHVVYSYEGQITGESNVPVKYELQLYLSNGLGS